MPNPSSVVTTTSGPVRGLDLGEVLEFRGIPYAGPVGGTRRFRAPVRPEPWSETFDAVIWPPQLPQTPDQMAAAIPEYYRNAFGWDYQDTTSEDGLRINLWTPAADDARRPVMVYLHGGAFAVGQASRPRENGANLAASQDVVVLSPSHRLGTLGFLAVPNDEGGVDANAGMLDLILALEWVRDNVAAFGGDPDRVMIFGESGGSLKVQTLLAMPKARGLFHRAACQSGAFPMGRLVPGCMSLEQALGHYAAVCRRLGVDPGDLETLRRLPADAFSGLLDDVAGTAMPVVEPRTLPQDVLASISDGTAADVPLIIGTDLHEMRVLHHADGPVTSKEIVDTVEGDTAALLEFYRDSGGDARRAPAEEAILSDYTFRIPSIRFAERRIARNRDVWMYLFNWENPDRPDVGAAHGQEGPFVFSNTDAIPNTRLPDSEGLAALMSGAWAALARTGDPAGEGSPIEWPRYELVGRSTVVFGPDATVVDDPLGSDRVAWERLAPDYGR